MEEALNMSSGRLLDDDDDVLHTHPATCKMGVGFFPGIKWPGHGADHSRPCSTGDLFPL